MNYIRQLSGFSWRPTLLWLWLADIIPLNLTPHSQRQWDLAEKNCEKESAVKM